MPTPEPVRDVGPAYRERLRVPTSWWIRSAVVVLAVWWVFVLALPMVVAVGVAAVVAALLGWALWRYGDAPVTVERGAVRAGRAWVELVHVGAVEALDADAAFLLRSRDADPRAYLLLRPYVATALRLEITDPADPAPYWYVSSRDPEGAARAIEAARGPVRD